MVVFMLLPSPITHQCIRSINNISKIIYELKRHTFSPWLPKSEESKPNPPRPYHFTGIKIGCFFESPGNLGFKLWQHGWCTLNPKLKKWASAHWIQNKKIRCTLNTKTKYFKHQNLSETQTFSRPNFFKAKLFQGQTFSDNLFLGLPVRVPTAGGGLWQKTIMTLGSIMYSSNCSPPPSPSQCCRPIRNIYWK